MSNRNRRPRSRTRRSGRFVWVNRAFAPTALVNNVLQAFDLLAVAPEFMVFDTTITRVHVPFLQVDFSPDATEGYREIRWNLQVARTTMDAPQDFQSMQVDSVGPPWMHTAGIGVQLPAGLPAGSQQNLLLSDTRNPADIKAKRRFRENSVTLFLLVETNMNAGDTGLSMNGLIRTLLWIP